MVNTERQERRTCYEIAIKTLPLRGFKVNKVIDLEVLRTLKELSPDDPAFLPRVIQLFLTTVPPELEKLRQCFKNGQAHEMGRVAHGILSSSQNLGALPMSEICLQLDHLGRDGKLDNARSARSVIFMTTGTDKSFLLQAKELRAGYILKPVDIKQLAAQLDSLVSK